MTEKLCPFEHSDLATSCFILGQRNALGIKTPCAMSPLCHAAKHVLRENADESLSLTKNALIYDIPTAVISNPLFEKYRFLADGDQDMENPIGDLANASKEELQKRLAEANRLVADAFAAMADLVQLNIATTAKSIEDTDKALSDLINVSDASNLANALGSRQENAMKHIREYNTKLAFVVIKAREQINESSNRQISELIERLEKLSQKIEPQQHGGNEYLEQFNANLKNSMNSYLEFTKKSQAFFNDYQNAWLATLHMGGAAEEIKEKTQSSKKK
ncbi:MAG: phasin family protein [Betaproteobacteria bacterium]